ncbi:MAG: DNA polymerase III subunit gamma/tau C-terminal domain-containing protein, partial [Gammaproteobacteria bacterium]
APEPPPAPAAAVDADALDWNRCIEELGLSGLPRELARNSAVRAFDGRRLELVVQPQYEKLAQRRHVDTLAAALGRLRGTDVVVEVQVEAGSTLATPSEQRSAEAARRQREAEAEIDGDPNVAVLRDRFGATVEDVSTR